MKNVFFALSILLVQHLSAAPLYQESFSYGGVTQDIENVSNWVTGSNVVLYDHDGGLTHAQLNQESGGSMHHDFGTGQRGGSNSDAAFNPFPTAGAGDEFWIAGLIQINALGDGDTFFRFDNGQSVNSWGFGVDAAGNVLLIGSNNGGTASNNDTGIDVTADGSTHLFISRATLGAGTSPTTSVIDFWFNPADTSSVTALGAPGYTTGADSKIGRDSGAYSSINSSLNYQNRVDEARFGTTLTDVVGIPEPGTLALVGLSLGVLALFRRRP